MFGFIQSCRDCDDRARLHAHASIDFLITTLTCYLSAAPRSFVGAPQGRIPRAAASPSHSKQSIKST